MKSNLPFTKEVLTYNDCVKKAYLQILKQMKLLLSRQEEEPLRYLLVRKKIRAEYLEEMIEHEVISHLFYLRLQQYEEYKLKIYFGFEVPTATFEYSAITAAFLRLLFKATMKSSTTVNIEDRLMTDYVITECSALFDYTDERSNDYKLLLLPYIPKTVKRKLQRVA